MSKPAAIQWLERETGAAIDYEPERDQQDRHLSVRLPGALADELDVMAAEQSTTVSRLVRQIVADAVRQRGVLGELDGRALADRLDADVAEIRRRLAR